MNIFVEMKIPAYSTFVDLESFERCGEFSQPLRCFEFSLGEGVSHHRKMENLEIYLLLSGSGQMDVDGSPQRVVSPCLIIKRPGSFLDIYWDVSVELLCLSYGESCYERFISSGVMSSSHRVIYFSLSEDLLAMIEKLKDASKSTPLNALGADLCDRLAEVILLNCRSLGTHLCDEKFDHKVKSLIRYLKYYCTNDLDVQGLSRRFGVKKKDLKESWFLYFPLSPEQCVHLFRIQKAREYLQEDELNVSEIASAVGYNSVQAFLRQFKKFAGLTPKQYQLKIRSGILGFCQSPELRYPLQQVFF